MSKLENTLPNDLFMDLDRSGPIPLYFQVARRMEEAILSGALPPGSRIENEIALGERIGLSRPTIRRAIQDLVDKGLVVRRRGIGTQVVNGQVRRDVELTSLYDDLNLGNKHPSTALLLHEVIPASSTVAEILKVETSSEVLHIRRLRLTDDVPVAVMENYLPSDFTDLAAEDLVKYGLYQMMRTRGTTMRVARQKISARAATTEEADLLGVAKHGPLLTMDRTAYDNSGRAVEFGHHCYRPDLYSFEVTLVEK